MRRSLEYTIHDHELKDTKRKLDELQEKRDNSGEQSNRLRDLLQTATDKIKVRLSRHCSYIHVTKAMASLFWFQSINKDVREKRAKIQGYVDEKESMSSEHQDLTKRKAKLELDIKDMMEEMEGDTSARVRLLHVTASCLFLLSSNKCVLLLCRKSRRSTCRRLASRSTRRERSSTELFPSTPR